jgi:hypothetical protein
VDAKSGEDMATLAAQTIVRLSRGEWPEGLVINPEVREPYLRTLRGQKTEDRGQ